MEASSGVDFVSGGYPQTSKDGKTVTLGPGKLFETGWWPDKNFSLNAAEADAAIRAGKAIPIEIEHVRSVLDGKLGFATFDGRSGGDLVGSLTIPKALADLLGTDKPLKVSMVWDAVTKTPLRLGLVVNPKITDAQVAAAFSAAENGIDTAAIYARWNALQRGEIGPLAESAGSPIAADIYARMNQAGIIRGLKR